MLPDLYLSSSSEKPPLRIGILLDSPVLAAAFASVIADIQRSDFARIELLVYNASKTAPGPSQPPAASRARTLWRLLRNRDLRQGLGWVLYTKLDQRFSRIQGDPLASVDCTGLLSGIDVMRVEPLSKRFVQRFPEEALETIQDRQLDVLVRFGFNILRGGILTAARYGMWSFHHGDNEYYRGGPPHFWEMVEGNPLSGVILQVLTEELDAGCVLIKGLFPTESALSLIRNRVQPYWGSVHFVIEKLWELHRFGWEHIQSHTIAPVPYQGKRKIYRRPGNLDVIRWAVPQVIKKAGRVLIAATGADTIKHWRMAVRASADPLLCEGGQPNLQGFRWIESRADHFYADPFLIEYEGRHWVFFEDYSYSDGRGVIACAELSKNGTMGAARVALDTGKHASYPYIFSDQGSIYMIPETLQDESVRLYRCVQFPDEWKLEADLFQGPVVDTSVYKREELWWFFVTIMEPRGKATGLYLFFSESLAGKWQYHPSNPISLDIRTARGAGSIQTCGTKLIRPSQDCSRRYGYAINFAEIITLSSRQYEERPMVTMLPSDQGLLGIHTYNRSGAFEVIDGLTPRRRSSIRGGKRHQ